MHKTSTPAQGYRPGGKGQPSQRPRTARATGQVQRYRRLIPDLRQGERVVLLERRHPIVLVRRLLGPIVLLLAWLVALLFLGPLLGSLWADPLVSAQGSPPSWLSPLLLGGWLLVALIVTAWAALSVIDWSGHWTAVTTHRLIMMDKLLFFRESRREAPIAKVQNVIAEYPSALGMSFDFGNLTVDTAGVGVLVSYDLPHPKVMREEIFARQAALRATQTPPEDKRKAAIESILLGHDPTMQASTTAPNRPQQPAVHNSLLDVILPLTPQRTGASVVWHKHWFILLRGIVGPAVVFLCVLLGWMSAVLFGPRGEVGTLETLLTWATLLLFPICLLWALWKWEDWRNDLYKLDHERVYHIESLPFGMREQSKETLITRITDVSYMVPSLTAHLFNYGDVVIKTPGESTEFLFKYIPSPREVQQEIMTRLDEYRLKENAGVDHEIEAWIKAYHDVTGKTP